MNKPLSHHRILALIGGTELLGKERGNLEALSSLQRQGATVMVGVSNRITNGGQLGQEARRRGFETREFPMGSHFSKKWMLLDRKYRHNQFRRLWSNSKEFKSTMREWNPSHIHIAAHDTFIFFAWPLIFNRIPLVFRCGDAPPSNSRFQLFVWKWLVRRSSTIITVSRFINNQLNKAAPCSTNKTKIIHNIAPTRQGRPNEALIKKLTQLKKPFQLVYVGQIHAIKGVHILIDGLIKLNDPTIGCWIVGGNPHTLKQEQSLREITKQTKTLTEIMWFGFQEDPRPYFTAADWHIAPSICQEAFGNVVKEAQMAGTPSIISGNGGLPETLIDRLSGIVVNTISAQSIAETILQAKNSNQHAYKIEAAKHGQETNQQHIFDEAWKDALT